MTESKIDFLKLAKMEAGSASDLPSNAPSVVVIERIEFAKMYAAIAQAEQLKRIADAIEAGKLSPINPYP